MRVEGVLLQVADHDLVDACLKVVDDVAKQVVRHRPRRRDVLDLEGDGVRLGDANPDGEHAGTILVAEDHDRQIGRRVDHQRLDRHLDLHRALAPATLCARRMIVKPARALAPRSRPAGCSGFAPVIRTGTSLPIDVPSPVKFTTVLPLVRPESSQSRRRLRESTRTDSTRPTACSCSPP